MTVRGATTPVAMIFGGIGTIFLAVGAGMIFRSRSRSRSGAARRGAAQRRDERTDP